MHGKGFEAYILEVEANCHGTCGLQGLLLIDQTALGIQCICYAWLEAKGLHERSEDGMLCSLYEEVLQDFPIFHPCSESRLVAPIEACSF